MNKGQPRTPKTNDALDAERNSAGAEHVSATPPPAGPAELKLPTPSPKTPRQHAPEQDPAVRARNFTEVKLDFTLEQAQAEALRCIRCKDPKCVEGCPVNVLIPDFLELILLGDICGAADKIQETNLLPAICGRVCQQENYCEKVCVVGLKRSPVAIGDLERFVADYDMAVRGIRETPCDPPTGKKVAIIGSGPASLTCASELARLGHQATVFEALHELGGVLVYGIPPFRLPREVLHAEIDRVRKMGVVFVTNFVVGMTCTIEELRKEYDAIFIGTGAGHPYLMDIPGEDYLGVYTANEFLTRVNLLGGWKFPDCDTPIEVGKRVVVVGGGNSAMDAARVALRMGPEKVYVFYRRSEVEMPARAEEVKHAMEEGIEFHFLAAPVKLEADANNRIYRMQCIQMQLGDADASGRRRPEPMPGSEFWLDVDTVIVAIGQGCNPIIQRTTPELRVTKRTTIQADERGETSLAGIFAGGDVIRGGSTVLLAMKDGRRAAASIQEYLLAKESPVPTLPLSPVGHLPDGQAPATGGNAVSLSPVAPATGGDSSKH